LLEITIEIIHIYRDYVVVSAAVVERIDPNFSLLNVESSFVLIVFIFFLSIADWTNESLVSSLRVSTLDMNEI
jgi:hypothetical protein